MEKDFKTYWKEKAQKRRKSWPAKAKIHAERHLQLEDVRGKMHYSIVKREDLFEMHQCGYNPICNWQGEKLYSVCSHLEICTLVYKQVSMSIYRYSMDSQPFGFYEVFPCLQLPFPDMYMEESSFNTLNIAMLLLEMEAEYELYQEGLNYYAKQLKIRTMKAVTAVSIK